MKKGIHTHENIRAEVGVKNIVKQVKQRVAEHPNITHLLNNKDKRHSQMETFIHLYEIHSSYVKT